MNALARLVADRMAERGLNPADVARVGGLPRSRVYQIVAMKEPYRRTPMHSTLERLAKGLDLPIEIVQRAAAESAGYHVYDGTAPDSDVEILIAAAEKLPAARRRALARMAQELLLEAEADTRG